MLALAEGPAGSLPCAEGPEAACPAPPNVHLTAGSVSL